VTDLAQPFAMSQPAMEAGMTDGYARLDALLAGLVGGAAA
jgi:hypothetical protein